jgi:hypothetical protein
MACTGRIASSCLTDRNGRVMPARAYFQPVVFNLAPSNNTAKDMKVMKNKRDDVGYGRAPIEHRFKPGRSGNPSGRPKDARRFTADLRDEPGEIVLITDGNERMEVTKQRAIIKALIRKALTGELRAIATIVSACARTVSDQEIDDQAEAPEDRAIMRAVAASPAKSSNSIPADNQSRMKNE